MSQHNQHFVTEQMTAELRYLHKVMQAIDILGEQALGERLPSLLNKTAGQK